MAVANYFHATRDKVKNQRTGYGNQVRLAPAAWFISISEPAALATDALAKTAVADSTFSTGKGFIKAYVLPESVEAPAESVGEAGALHLDWKPKFFIPGDTPELQEMIEEQFMNQDLVALLTDSNCPDGGVRQFGCDCTPLICTKVSFESGVKSSGKKGWLLETSTDCRYFYTGTVTDMP